MQTPTRRRTWPKSPAPMATSTDRPASTRRSAAEMSQCRSLKRRSFIRPRFDTELKNVRARIMPDDVEVHLGPHDVVHVERRVERLFAIPDRTGQQVAERSDDATPPAAHDLRLFAHLVGQ